MATSIINVHKSAKYTPCPLLIVVELRFSLINTIWHKSQSFLCLLQCGFYDVFPKYSTLLATCTSNSNTNMPLSYNQYGCYFKKKTENLQLRTKDRRLNNPIQWPHVCSHREYCKFGHKWHRRWTLCDIILEIWVSWFSFRCILMLSYPYYEFQMGGIDYLLSCTWCYWCGVLTHCIRI